MKASREEAIRAAAARLFAEKGYQATGIADVARALGMGHGTFYRYFEDKRDVFESVVEEALLSWGRAAPEPCARTEPGAVPVRGRAATGARLRAYGLAKQRLFEARPALRPLLFRETPALDAALAARLRELQRACAGELELMLLDGSSGDAHATSQARPAAALLASRLFDLLRELESEDFATSWQHAIGLVLAAVFAEGVTGGAVSSMATDAGGDPAGNPTAAARSG